MSFYDEVYALVEQIPFGTVATYGQLAVLLGRPRAARAVGYALQKAPRHLGLPCHRVVNRLGEMAPAPAFGGEGVQRQLLLREGVPMDAQGRADLRLCQWHGPGR